MILDESATAAFIEKKKAADEARAVLIDRLAAIKTEKKETLARLREEAHQIRALLGRVRAPKGTKAKTTRPRKPKPAAGEAAETA